MHLPTPQGLRKRREELELTQSDLAERAGVSQPLIARIEGGDVDPRLSTLRRIVSALDEAEGDETLAEELMHDEVVSVAPTDSVADANTRMQEAGFSQLPVVEDGIPVGSITESDVASAGENAGDAPVRAVMSEAFPTVPPGGTLDEIQDLLNHRNAVMVTTGGKMVGIITEADLAKRVS
jgi:predicted transcriptional regulator